MYLDCGSCKKEEEEKVYILGGKPILYECRDKSDFPEFTNDGLDGQNDQNNSYKEDSTLIKIFIDNPAAVCLLGNAAKIASLRTTRPFRRQQWSHRTSQVMAETTFAETRIQLLRNYGYLVDGLNEMTSSNFVRILTSPTE